MNSKDTNKHKTIMSRNKYDNLVEEINRKEEIAEQKDNLTKQLNMVVKNVNDVKEIVDKLVTAIEDLKKTC